MSTDSCQLPEGFSLAEAVTLPNNFVTVFHTLTEDLGIETPWPRPDGYTPENASKPILIWGGSSSVGQFAIQILRYYGYTNILATASRKHHERLRDLGARDVYDYNDPDVVSSILQGAGSGGVSFVFDCIGSKQGSIAPISRIAVRGTRVAILLPVIVKDSTDEQDPEYEMDVEKAAGWAQGVDVRGVRTHFYLNVSIQKQNISVDPC
jgi:NADPH:quinone reductase-like Zn-dependent oxidoreductase